MTYPKLYTRNTNGTINVWWAEVLEDGSYITNYGQQDGKIQTTLPVTCEPKNVGKKNATSALEQAEKEVLALYKKQRKMNYFDDIAEIDNAWEGPMLCSKFKDRGHKIQWDALQIVDYKLNGVRCVITRNGARSRRNEVFLSIPHILKELKPFFEKYPDAVLDGELYNPAYMNHLGKVTECVSVTRKEKDITPELLKKSEEIVQYHVYDAYGYNGVKKDTPFFLRRMVFDFTLHDNFDFKSIKLVDFISTEDEAEAMTYAEEYIAKGGEGVVIKDSRGKYVNKRSNDCVKYKKMESEEFEVISIEEGNGDWTGCAKFVWCKLPNGLKDDKFKSNVKGKREHLRVVFEHRESYVGQMITVDFQELSPDNVPLIPYTDLLIRNYE